MNLGNYKECVKIAQHGQNLALRLGFKAYVGVVLWGNTWQYAYRCGRMCA